MRTIHFPGNHGQRCQAQFAIGVSETKTAMFPRTEVLFVEDAGGNPGGTFCNLGDTPDFLATKVLKQDLEGCRIEFVDFFYAGLPDAQGRREVYRWPINPDLEDFIRHGGEHEVLEYASILDQLKALAGLKAEVAKFSTNSVNVVGGSCRVRVDLPHRTLEEEDRIRILHRFGVLSR